MDPRNGRAQMSRVEKIQFAADGLAESPAFKRNVQMPAYLWAMMLETLDEEKIDGFLMLLDEENGLYKDIEEKDEKRKVKNGTRYLQRLERIRVTAEMNDDNLSK